MCLCGYFSKMEMLSKRVYTLHVVSTEKLLSKKVVILRSKYERALCLTPLPTLCIHSFKTFADLMVGCGDGDLLLFNLQCVDY